MRWVFLALCLVGAHTSSERFPRPSSLPRPRPRGSAVAEGAGAAAAEALLTPCEPGWELVAGGLCVFRSVNKRDPLVVAHAGSVRSGSPGLCDVPRGEAQPPRCLAFEEAERECQELHEGAHLVSLANGVVEQSVRAGDALTLSFDFPIASPTVAGSWVGLRKALLPPSTSAFVELCSLFKPIETFTPTSEQPIPHLPPKDTANHNHQSIDPHFFEPTFTDGKTVRIGVIERFFMWDKPDEVVGKPQCAAFAPGGLDLFPCEYRLPYTCAYPLFRFGGGGSSA
mmetsp:Transcript_6293/g.21091  ORF Transcript_6293/g.21091 Transcript_6293/m.21091 type:complete len:283 (-) Transcript_6293:154-1002(-)